MQAASGIWADQGFDGGGVAEGVDVGVGGASVGEGETAVGEGEGRVVGVPTLRVPTRAAIAVLRDGAIGAARDVATDACGGRKPDSPPATMTTVPTTRRIPQPISAPGEYLAPRIGSDAGAAPAAAATATTGFLRLTLAVGFFLNERWKLRGIDSPVRGAPSTQSIRVIRRLHGGGQLRVLLGKPPRRLPRRPTSNRAREGHSAAARA